MKGRASVEVYVSSQGYVCIKQESGTCAEEEAILLLEPGQAPTVTRWLQDALPNAERTFDWIEEEPPPTE